jgi:hypothetical protein
MGTKDGIIIAAIIANHMPRNAAAAPGQVCPGIRIDGMDMDMDPWTVTPAPMTNSSVQAPMKAHSEFRH